MTKPFLFFIILVFISTFLLKTHVYASGQPGQVTNNGQNTTSSTNSTSGCTSKLCTTASKTTAVGNPPTSGNATGSDLANYALKVVTTLQNNNAPPYQCFHVQPKDAYLGGFAYIIKPDISCVQPPPILDGAIQSLFTYSVNHFFTLECVNFVQAIAQATNHTIDTAGNALDFSRTVIPSKYRWIPITNFTKPDGTIDPNKAQYDGTKANAPDFVQAGDISIWSDDGNEPGHIAIVVKPLGITYIEVAEGNGHGQGEVDTTNYDLKHSDYYGLQLEGWLRLK